MKRALKVLGVLVLVLVLGLVITGFVLHRPRPEGHGPGEDADGVARRMEAAVNADAWARTGAVQWTFRGSHEHVWDRQRNLAWVRWDDVDVRMRLDDRTGIVTRNGRETLGEERQAFLDEAYAFWINDSFWLNPVVKTFDDGVTRELVDVESGDGLLISYASGGLTPGDQYLWIVAEDGLPKAWRMWVSIIPIGGLEASWDDWVTLDTGAKVATRHEILFLTLELSDVAGAESLGALLDDDPFAEL